MDLLINHYHYHYHYHIIIAHIDLKWSRGKARYFTTSFIPIEYRTMISALPLSKSIAAVSKSFTCFRYSGLFGRLISKLALVTKKILKGKCTIDQTVKLLVSFPKELLLFNSIKRYSSSSSSFFFFLGGGGGGAGFGGRY